MFKVASSIKRNEGRYQKFFQYPRHHPLIDSLRPELQLELTESQLLEPALFKSISSLYTKELGQEPELSNFPCVSMELTVSEKLVSLLRRTAAHERNNKKEDDETLIRHVYDLHLIW